jgi:hypothetical protein
VFKLISAALLGCALIAGATAEATAPKSLVVHLTPLNNSGETATATLTDSPDGVVVTIKATPVSEAPQPLHVHTGTCKDSGNVAYALKTLQDGTSKTTIPKVTIADLEKTPNVLNIHKSTTEMGTYVSCGEIAAPK